MLAKTRPKSEQSKAAPTKCRKEMHRQLARFESEMERGWETHRKASEWGLIVVGVSLHFSYPHTVACSHAAFFGNKNMSTSFSRSPRDPDWEKQQPYDGRRLQGRCVFRQWPRPASCKSDRRVEGNMSEAKEACAQKVTRYLIEMVRENTHLEDETAKEFERIRNLGGSSRSENYLHLGVFSNVWVEERASRTKLRFLGQR